MLSGLAKAEKTPNKGWKTNSLVEYSSDEEDSENSQQSSADDEVLLLEEDDKSTRNSLKKHKSPLEYTRQEQYKIPKLAATSTPNGTSNDFPKSTSTDRYNELGFSSSFSSLRSVTQNRTRSTHPSSRAARDVQYRIKRQFDNSRFGVQTNRNTYKSPQPNLSVARTRKNKGPFEDEINMQMHNHSRRKETPKNTRYATKNVTDDHNSKGAVEVSDGDSDMDRSDKRIKISHENSEDGSCEQSNRRKQKLPQKMDKVSVNSDGNKSQKETRTKHDTSLEGYYTDFDKSIEYFSSALHDHKSTSDEESNKSVDKSHLRHVFPSSKATPRPPLHQSSGSDSNTDRLVLDIELFSSEKPKVTAQRSQEKDQSNVQSGGESDDSGCSDSINAQPSTDKASKNAKSENNDDSSNKNSFYGPRMKTYGKNKGSSLRVKRLTCLQNGDKQRDKVNNDDAPGGSKEPAKKRIPLKTNKTKKKNEPKQVSLVEIISSDEEEKAESNTKFVKPATATTSDTSEMPTKSTRKEQRNPPKPAAKSINENPFPRDTFSADIQLGQRIFLGCLQVTPLGPLEISVDHLKWKMEHNSKTVTLVVRPVEFTSLKVHVDSDPKIIVLEVAQCLALRLRERFSGNGKFIDPGSPVSGEKGIIFEVDDNLKPELIADLSEWVIDTHSKHFEELSQEEAEKLISCYTSQNAPKGRHYNTRSGKTTQPSVTPAKLIIYPPPPSPGGITVTSADLECLAAGEFLNDVIIDFYLKYIYHAMLNDVDRERTYIFSTYFYKRLTQRMSSDAASTSDNTQSYPERMHNKVKKWTRNVDIFEKDFIIVPINESSHWFLAIICFPYLEDEIVTEESDSDDKSQESVEVVKSSEDDSDDFAETKKSNKDLPPITASPCILIFDSLSASGRSRVYTNLRNYLTCEWKSKRPNKQARDFNKENIKGSFPKVPQQENHCDCGVFILEYVQSFFTDPITNYRPPIDKRDWFTQAHIYTKRDEIKDLIVCLSNEESTSLCSKTNNTE